MLDVTEFDYINHPAWLVFDDHYLRRYGLAGFKAGQGKTTPEWMVEATKNLRVGLALGEQRQDALLLFPETRQRLVDGARRQLANGV